MVDTAVLKRGDRVLITGGAGFIGRALATHCVSHGASVTVVDNLCSGRVENLAHLLDEIEFYEVDILDQSLLSRVMLELRPDIVFHLAAHHYIPFCNAHPADTLWVNVEGTYHVLSEAARSGTRRAVLASTGAIYPSHDAPLSEDIEPEPVDVYGLSKHLAENVAHTVGRTTGMCCVVARLFNTYGPHETNPHLIPHILESLRRGPRVELGNLHTSRDYIFVEDVADLLYAIAMSDADVGTAVVNVGTGLEHSVKDILQILESLLGYPIEVSVDPGRVRVVDKRHQRADIARLERVTGMRARFGLKEGLHELLVYEGLIPGGEEEGKLTSDHLVQQRK
jgi:UDP-glucose 4-epimerase